MAFNPFHAFRKHQKPLLAALAIFCMLMFVMSSGLGRGDAVYQAMDFFGISRGKGPLVATLHGKKVTEGDLARLRRDRELASNFLFLVAHQSAVNKFQAVANEGRKSDGKENPAVSPEISRLASICAFVNQDSKFRQAFGDPHEIYLNGLKIVRDEKLRLGFGPNSNPEAVQTVDELERALAFEAWATDPQRPRREYYFGGNPETAQLLDFILWEQQADRLGVVLTEADLIAAVNHEGLDQNLVTPPTLNGDPFVRTYLERGSEVRGATAEQLRQALTREFRYFLARAAVLGEEGGARAVRTSAVPQMPAAPTPRQFLEWYVAQRTTLKVAMLPVPVEAFVDRVQEKPSEQALKALYEQYKGDEPVPDRQTPGFKEPRRVRVETVDARPDSPFYQNAARAQALTSSVARQTAPVAAGLFGGPLVAAASALWPLAYNPLESEYRIYAGEMRSMIRNGQSIGVDLRDRRPLYAGTVAQALGATPAGPLSAATGAVAGEVFYRLGHATVAASLVGASAGNNPLAGMGLPYPYWNTLQPPEQVESTLFDRVVNGLAPRLVTNNLVTVATEVQKLKNRPDDERAYIAKAVKDYGLTEHLMGRAETRFQLDKDPALAALRDAVAAEDAANAVEGARPVDVSRVVLGGPTGVYEPQRFPPDRWDFVKEPFLWWRVEDLQSHERAFDAVRGQVEAAWRLEKARALAREEAKRIDAEVRKNVEANRSAAEAVRVLREHGRDFELTDVARLLPMETPRADISQPYRPYSPPRERIEYPLPDLVDRLMALKKPGDSLVVRDKPAKTFYVAVLQERSDPIGSTDKPNLRSFLEEYRLADRPGSMWQQYFMPERRRAYALQVVKQMRIDATGGKVDESGNIILPPDVSRGFETDTGE